MRNYVLELFRPEIEVKMKEERMEGRAEGRVEGRAEGKKILYQAVQRLRKGETVEQLRRSGIDRKDVEAAEQLWLLIKEKNQGKVE